MTVSRCIRKQPGVATATQEKVDNALRELNYRPHPFVSAHMSQIRRSKGSTPTANLAYLTFGDHPEVWQKHMPTKITFEGAQQTASEYGFNISQIWADDP